MALQNVKDSLERSVTDPLTSRVVHLDLPLDLAPDANWQPFPLYQGSTGILHYLSCHVSVLRPGRTPHPPHAHSEEELLLVLDGEADLQLPDAGGESADENRVRLVPGDFVYYPAGKRHSLVCAGDKPVTYFMLSWKAPPKTSRRQLKFNRFHADKDIPGEKDRFRTIQLARGETDYLRKLEVHLSLMPPGEGYAPHADAHDVAIVVLDGELETLGQQVCPFDVIFYRSGEAHAMRNTGDTDGRYLVVEFHGPDMPISETWLFRTLTAVLRKLVPRNLRRRIRGFLSRMGMGHG